MSSSERLHAGADMQVTFLRVEERDLGFNRLRPIGGH